MRNLCSSLLFLLSLNCVAQTREIAITIDDLPLVASKMDTVGNQQRSSDRFSRIIAALVDNNVPATGFVIAGSIQKGQWAFLEQFRNAGFEIGNHTYSHYNLNRMTADRYIADVDRADQQLAPLLTEPKYFRYPYLAEGNKTTKPEVLNYLAEHHYVVAPVTIDSKDYDFNERLYKVPFRTRDQYVQTLKPSYLSYIWKQTLKAEHRAHGASGKQILLIHANLLNSYLLDDVIKMYKNNGYTFITLTEALKNPAPALALPAAETNTNEQTVTKPPEFQDSHS